MVNTMACMYLLNILMRIFTERNFDDYRGNLWKCTWPADLTYEVMILTLIILITAKQDHMN